MKKVCVVFAVMLGMFLNVAHAQKPAVVGDNEPGWKRIGQVTASFKKQNESIVVLGADKFTALKLKVREAAIDIERVQVFYESGAMEELNVPDKFKDGSESAVLNLSHPYRDIKKVAFTYKTLPNAKGDKADLELYGLKTDQEEHADTYTGKKADDAADEVGETTRETRDDLREKGREAGDEVERNAHKTESDTERAVENTGDNISEAAAKVMADIKDKRHDTKVGPKGQVVFITNEGRYYYINNEGRKVYVTELELKDKKDNH